MSLQQSIVSCIACILLLNISVDCKIFKRSTIEGLLTPQEREHYLPKKNSDHKYEIVKVFTKRSTESDTLNLYFKTTRENKELVLIHKKDYLLPKTLPVWLGMPQMGQHKYVQADISLLQNTLKHYTSAGGASFSIADVMSKVKSRVKRIRRETRINGIMDDITIRSLSSTITNKLSRAKRDIDEDEYHSEYHNNNYTEMGYHLVLYTEKSENSEKSGENVFENNGTPNIRVKRNDLDGLPDTLYPRILLTTHYNNGFKTTDDPEIENLILYILTFLGAVDLKFFAFENPKVRLHCAGIIIETLWEALPYISENQLLRDPQTIEIHDTIRQMSAYYRQQTGELDAILDATQPDMAISITNLKLCELSEQSKCKYLYGISGQVQHCERVHDLKAWKINLFSLIHDADFSFHGIFTAAHEIGHLLGAQSDANDNYYESNYNMMSEIPRQIRIPVSKNYWSTDSINSIRATALDRTSSNCLNFFDQPITEEFLVPLPGERVVRDQQCRAKGAEQSCGRNSCLLRCKCATTTANCSSDCTIKGYVLDGTMCRGHPSEHCINGKCIPTP